MPETTPTPPAWDRRPLTGGGNARRFSLLLPPDLRADLETAARARGMPAATYVRQLIRDACTPHT